MSQYDIPMEVFLKQNQWEENKRLKVWRIIWLPAHILKVRLDVTSKQGIHMVQDMLTLLKEEFLSWISNLHPTAWPHLL
jgi:hypothetical protein